ncbi:hypothetical protein Tco_0451904 [Tanacetum coccineum]
MAISSSSSSSSSDNKVQNCSLYQFSYHGSETLKNHLSDNEESLGDDASKQGRIDIGDIDNDAEITLIDETQGRINDIVADEDITLIPKLIIK